jgi:phosphoenolpyruvate carboxylase
LEDSAYDDIHDENGNGSYSQLVETLEDNPEQMRKLEELFGSYRVRIILTAHPTQFYPGEVLGIITDLSTAITANNLPQIKLLLEQLGRTPFFKKIKPTPFDEALSLVWFLENVFYFTLPTIYESIYESLGANAESIIKDSSLMKLGFWPGGDRDGNPGVTAETTLAVADRLRESLFRCYYREIRQLKRKLTFVDILPRVTKIEAALHESGYTDAPKATLPREEVIEQLKEIEEILHDKYNGLYARDVRAFRHKFNVFKYHFSALDVRQDSRIIRKTMEAIRAAYPTLFPDDYEALSDNDKTDILMSMEGQVDPDQFDDPLIQDTIKSLQVMQEIQRRNGPEGSYRYIISNCGSTVTVAEVFALANLTSWGDKKFLDIIPLFETIDDLAAAGDIMTELYHQPVYAAHLEYRVRKQVVMLGFSDGTKDGGYITANWGIFKAKEMITSVSRNESIRVIFFDGRGGPPARGGGNTHKFYASLGKNIESSQIQLTIQGQTISSNFGTLDSAKFNVEQLLTAGLENNIFDNESVLTKEQRALLDELSAISYKTYQQLKDDALFVPYLEEISPLTYYGMANIGSRPSKRGTSTKLDFGDLRAIPFVGAWSQLKQNVPGYFGLGSAIKDLDAQGRLNEVKELYQQSLFFRTLIENSMQSLSKTHFFLTSYLKEDPKFGKFWQWLNDEHALAEKYALLVSDQARLLDTNPSIRESINLREKTVLPLLTIQQYALIQLRKLKESGGDQRLIETYEKLVIRTLYGNINASRNSA